VSKDELFEAVWVDTVVSEATLTSAIQEIRKALQDNAREPQYVETVPKRGFRFIGKVVNSQEEKEEQKANGNSRLESMVQSLVSNGQGLESSGQSVGSEEPQRRVTAQRLPEEPRLQVIANGAKQLLAGDSQRASAVQRSSDARAGSCSVAQGGAQIIEP
jgi:hypothetical protein